MKKHIPSPTLRSFLISALFAGTACVTAASALPQDLEELVERVSELTGDRYVYGNLLGKKKTGFSANAGFDASGADRILTNVLLMHELVRVPSGELGRYYIVEAKNAIQSPIPVFEASLTREARLPDTFDIATLKYQTVDPQTAEVLQRFLVDLVPRYGRVTAFPDSGYLLITDSAPNLRRIVDILKSVDRPLSASFKKDLRERYARRGAKAGD